MFLDQNYLSNVWPHYSSASFKVCTFKASSCFLSCGSISSLLHPSEATEQIFPKLSRAFLCGLNPTVPRYAPREILGRRVMSKGPDKGSFRLQLWLHRSPSSWKGIAITSRHPTLPHPGLCFVLQSHATWLQALRGSWHSAGLMLLLLFGSVHFCWHWQAEAGTKHSLSYSRERN